MITANKGEWSELYVLLKLLGEKKVYAGDGDLRKLDVFYPILKIIRHELENHMGYSIDERNNAVIITKNEREVAKINVGEFLEQAQKLFQKIQDGGPRKGAFEIPSQNDFLKKIHCTKIKAKSQDKSDIHIVIHDYHTGMAPELGFSIKSDAGAAPTLLNASTHTTIRYEIVGEGMNDSIAEKINAISGSRKIQKRLEEISMSGCSLQFDSIPSSVFEGNLQMVDSCLPKIISWMMADCYLHKDMDIKHAIERVTKENPLKYDLSGGHNFYGYKIKSLMVCIALGMLPGTSWTGRYEATGGYLVVKEDGDVVCFHIYDRNLLEDYLVSNTKFETPDGKRYNMGRVYRENDKYYFNLVTQIRFK